jgi:hypothetical protein
MTQRSGWVVYSLESRRTYELGRSISQHPVKPPKEVDPQSDLKDSKALLVGEKDTEAKIAALGLTWPNNHLAQHRKEACER